MPTFLLSFNKALLSMGVPHCILTQEALIPQPPSMLTAPLCIDILMTTRNLAIESLVEQGEYNRLLFSNDVFVKAEAIIGLHNTRYGEHDMVCGVHFHN
ncbi:Glycosyltransferase family 69 protein [Mycena venus]|uniref:Glycosyltransferase family 69 protein n=1 Tax=Mycena venus TaxID=2733690 RepID=A0A8H7DDS4_9AGAR|nr:Glycosyltransferase family 69 protein [Mycena venus]